MNVEHRRTIDEMQNLAKSRGGKCLSKKYVNARTKLLWECKEGHRWSAVPDSVKRGTWCPKCAIKKRAASHRGTIEEMQKIAASRRGKCLSKEYVNAHKKLRWQCRKEHEWDATPMDVKSGTWCPYCAGIAKLSIAGRIKSIHCL